MKQMRQPPVERLRKLLEDPKLGVEQRAKLERVLRLAEMRTVARGVTARLEAKARAGASGMPAEAKDSAQANRTVDS